MIAKSDAGVTINGKSKVTAADNAATNGVVHIIDAVLIPATSIMAPPKPTKNIAELAVSVSDLSTLVTALKAGDLVSALQGDGPFTVFAPTNAAFGKLPKADLDKLLQPENVAQLVQVLKYHIVPGAAVYSKDLQATQNVKTLEGQDLTVAKSNAGVTINGKAKVTAADNAATNGVVHIIDAVLMPPTSSGTPPSEPVQQQAVTDASATLSSILLSTLFCIVVGVANL